MLLLHGSDVDMKQFQITVRQPFAVTAISQDQTRNNVTKVTQSEGFIFFRGHPSLSTARAATVISVA
jgi:hypothetical protein